MVLSESLKDPKMSGASVLILAGLLKTSQSAAVRSLLEKMLGIRLTESIACTSRFHHSIRHCCICLWPRLWANPVKARADVA